MGKHGAAYKDVIGELKERINKHGSSRLHKKEASHKEPDGDEDAEGREYPGSPDDMTDTENVSVQEKRECSDCGGKMNKHGDCPACDAKPTKMVMG